MPPVRPALIEEWARHPRVGWLVRLCHNAWLRAWYPRRLERARRAGREALRNRGPSLVDEQTRLISDLAARGVASTSFNDLVGDTRLWELLQTTARSWADSPEALAGERAFAAADGDHSRWKEYIVRCYGVGGVVPHDSPWLALGMRPEILDVATAYLGTMGRMLYLDLWNCLPGKGRPLIGSQRWHRDPEDLRLCKVFLYLSDVGADCGPLELVLHSRRGERWGGLWPQRVAGNYPRPPEGAVEATVPESDRLVCAHPAGTLVFVDTTGLHRGGLATTGRRLLATWTFATQATLYPRTFRIAPPADPTALPREASLALSGP